MTDKLTYEQAVSALKEAAETPQDWCHSWNTRVHPILGKATKIDATIEDYSEGAVTESIVVLFENCETAIGFTTVSNSWDESGYGEYPEPEWWPARKETREVWVAAQ